MSYEVYCPRLNVPLLIIPEDHPPTYSTKPLKWIRYAAFAVLGVEGYLMKYSKDEACEDNLTIDMEDVAPSTRKLMFHPTSSIKFIDEHGCYSDVSYMTRSHQLQENFKIKVLERDKVGVGLDAPDDLQYWHVIPSKKGSRYIQAVCKWRNRTGEPDIEDIEDIRNGVLLDLDTRVYLGMGCFGVLRTPNFALAVDEVLPSTTKPNQNTILRFIPHHFIRSNPHHQKHLKEIQQGFRYPAIVNGWPVDWPPAFLWDFNYGVFVARKYGNRKAMDVLSNQVKPYYYDNCPEDYKTPSARDEAHIEIQTCREEGRHREYKKKERKLSDVMDDVLRLSMFSGPPVIETAGEEPERQEQRRQQVVEKVEIWRTTMAD